MSDKAEPEQPASSRGYNAGGLVAFPLPDEIVVPLRREELDTLCEGGISEERANRDLYIGAAAGGLAGLIGVLATTDWETTWKPERRWFFLIPLLVLCVMTAISTAGARIHHNMLGRTMANSAFSRLRARLLRLFDETRTPVALIERVPVSGAQTSSEPGIRWENVANLFWLGSDLQWTIETVRNGAPKERILHGFKQSTHHMSEVGMTNTDAWMLLSILRSQAESVPEGGMTEQWRSGLAGRLSQVQQEISGLAKAKQPAFRPSA